MKIWYFTADLLLVEYTGVPYVVERETGKKPVQLDTNLADSVEVAFERYMKFTAAPWYHGRCMPKLKSISRELEVLFRGGGTEAD